MMQGKLEEVRQTFQKVIAAHPDIALGHVSRAQTHLREHRGRTLLRTGVCRPGIPRGGTRGVAQVIQLDPGHTGAHYQLGRIYGQFGDAAKARQMAEQTRRLIQAQCEEELKAQRVRLGELEPLEQP